MKKERRGKAFGFVRAGEVYFYENTRVENTKIICTETVLAASERSQKGPSMQMTRLATTAMA